MGLKTYKFNYFHFLPANKVDKLLWLDMREIYKSFKYLYVKFINQIDWLIKKLINNFYSALNKYK